MAEEVTAKLLEEGDKFGDYTVVKLLGKGGMGAVYLMQGTSGSQYAVKIMFPEMVSHEMRRRFLYEAEFAIKIRHRNLVPVYDVGEDPETGLCYMIMDYMPGGSLADRLKKHGRLPVWVAVSIAAQVALGLEKAHRHGLVHRDVKPDNILFDIDGIPRLADLGIAKFENGDMSKVTTTNMVIGTPAYMAPEQMLNSHEIDARADIYSLGVVLYEMLSGERPNEGCSVMELLAKAIKGESLPDVRTVCSDTPAEISYVISLMCAQAPEGRPQSAVAAADLLRKAASGNLVIPRKQPGVSAEERAMHIKRIKMWSVYGAAVFFTAAFLIVGITKWIRGGSKLESASQTAASRRTNKRRGVTDHRVRYAKVGRHMWYYTLEDGEAVIWRGENGYNNSTRPAVNPCTDEHVTVPSELGGYKVAAIGGLAFFRCEKMKSIQIPEGVRKIQGSSFHDCSALKDVRLPSTLEKIEGWAFNSCQSLEVVDVGDCPDISFGSYPNRVIVSKSNPSYVEKDGAIYTRDGKTLVFFPRMARSASLPSTLERIADRAFYGCKNLETIKIPGSVRNIGSYAFSSCSDLASIELADGLSEIGYGAFGWCSRLKKISFPRTLEKIGEDFLRGCSSLNMVEFYGNAPTMPANESVFDRTSDDLLVVVHRGSKGWKAPGSEDLPERWPAEGFDDSRRICFSDSPEALKAGEAATLKDVAGPRRGVGRSRRGITDGRVRYAKVGRHTWYYTLEDGEAVIWRGESGYNNAIRPAVDPSTDEHVTVPSELGGYKVVAIGSLAFFRCKMMKSVHIPEGIREIRGWSFYDCSALKDVRLPSTLEKIEEGAFDSCQSLEVVDVGDCPDISFGSYPNRVIVSKSNPSYVEKDGAIYTRDGKTLVFFPRTAQSAHLPDSLVCIADRAFYGCKNLETIKIPGSVRNIDSWAFSYCGKLTSVEFADGLSEIGNRVFKGCYSLQKISFPRTLEKVGVYLFDRCRGLKTIEFRGDAPTTPAGRTVLGKTDADLMIVVHRGSKGWKAPDSEDLPERWPEEGFDDSRRICLSDSPEAIPRHIAKLAHRWSFNGKSMREKLTDSVGGLVATKIGNAVTFKNGEAVLYGDGHGTGSLNLGKGILGDDSATIEIWATRTAVKFWARLFDYGINDRTYCMVTWAAYEENIRTEVVKDGKLGSSKHGPAPWKNNEEFYIAVIFTPQSDGNLAIKWVVYDPATGEKKDWVEFHRIENGISLADLADANFYLGHSQYGDPDANAKYNEVRIWKGVLSDADIARNVKLGPNVPTAEL